MIKQTRYTGCGGGLFKIREAFHLYTKLSTFEDIILLEENIVNFFH